jgi:hypothetical protein
MPLQKFAGMTRTQLWEAVQPIMGGKGCCSDFDEWNGEVEYFEYPHHRFREKDGQWFLDYCLMRNQTGGFDSYALPLNELVGVIAQQCQLFGVPAELANVVFVNWYTGADEPFEYVETSN